MTSNDLEKIQTSVSSSDLETVLSNDTYSMVETVSGSDINNNLSENINSQDTENMNNNYTVYINNVETETYSLWDKPLQEYTTQEGLLLLILLITIATFIKNLIGGLSWRKY